MSGGGPARAPEPGGVVVFRADRGASVDQDSQDRQVPRPSPELVGVLGSPLISTDAAAKALRDLFLANADRGNDAANDELVDALVRRIRALRPPNDGGS